MWLWVGLGNPGRRYAGNRHNVGFMAVEAVARRWNAPGWRRQFEGETSELRFDGERVLLLRPQTFMNESGRSVAAAARFFRIPPERILVFHDELDLPTGRVRIKKGGGTAGHRGLESIAQHLGSRDFWRVRIGIGHPGSKERVVGWVLSDFRPEELELVEPVLDALAALAPELAKGRFDLVQNRLAALWRELTGSSKPGPQGPISAT